MDNQQPSLNILLRKGSTTRPREGRTWEAPGKWCRLSRVSDMDKI